MISHLNGNMVSAESKALARRTGRLTFGVDAFDTHFAVSWPKYYHVWWKLQSDFAGIEGKHMGWQDRSKTKRVDHFML